MLFPARIPGPEARLSQRSVWYPAVKCYPEPLPHVVRDPVDVELFGRCKVSLSLCPPVRRISMVFFSFSFSFSFPFSFRSRRAFCFYLSLLNCSHPSPISWGFFLLLFRTFIFLPISYRILYVSDPLVCGAPEAKHPTAGTVILSTCYNLPLGSRARSLVFTLLYFGHRAERRSRTESCPGRN